MNTPEQAIKLIGGYRHALLADFDNYRCGGSLKLQKELESKLNEARKALFDALIPAETKFIVKYQVHEYEPYLGSHREEIFNDLHSATKRANRINRYVSHQDGDSQDRYLGHVHDAHREAFDREMTDHCSFFYTSKAKIIQRTIRDKDVDIS